VQKPKNKRTTFDSDIPPQAKRGRRAGDGAEEAKAPSLRDDKAPLRLTADLVDQLPEAARREAHAVLESCWPANKAVQKVINSLVSGQKSAKVEIFTPMTTAVSAKGIGAGGTCTMSVLLPRLALVWAGHQVVAAAVYRNSHEERAEGDGPQQHRVCRQQQRTHTTEILLFGVRDGWRRFKIGSALVAYMKHLAMAHGSTRLLALYDPGTDGVQTFWNCNLEKDSPAFSGEQGTQVCTALFYESTLRLGIAELGKKTTEGTLVALKEAIAVATAERSCRKAVATQANGLEPDVLLGWFYLRDHKFFLAEYVRKEQLGADIKHHYEFFEPPQTVSTVPDEPPCLTTWREAAAAMEAGLERGMAMYNRYFVAAAVPTEPMFAEQMAMQRFLPKELPKRKPTKQAMGAGSSSEAASQPHAEREQLSFFYMCAGTGMLAGVLANMDYKGIMVSRLDDGRGGKDALHPHNWYHAKRPSAGDEQLERLSATLRERGIGEGDVHKRVRLWTMDTSKVCNGPSDCSPFLSSLLSAARLHAVSWQINPKRLDPVTVVVLDTQCTTRSKSSAFCHQRRRDNNFCGITKECRTADVEYAIQIMLVQWLQYYYPDVLIIIENPEDGIEKHPLTQECVLAPREKGGLGLMKDRFTNCFFTSVRDGGKVFRKPEMLLHNSELTRHEFGDGAMYCDAKTDCTCGRVSRGQNHDKLHAKECSASAAFTYELATVLARQIHRGVSMRMRRKCPHGEHSHVPYKDVREVLIKAFQTADEIKQTREKKASYQYEESWQTYMAWEPTIRSIHGPPPVQVRPPTPSFLALMPPAPPASSSTSASDDEGTDVGEGSMDDYPEPDEQDAQGQLQLQLQLQLQQLPEDELRQLQEEGDGDGDNDDDDDEDDDDDDGSQPELSEISVNAALAGLKEGEPRGCTACRKKGMVCKKPGQPDHLSEEEAQARLDWYAKCHVDVPAPAKKVRNEVAQWNPEAEAEAQKLVNRRVEVWWDGNKQWFAGMVESYVWEWELSRERRIRHVIAYDDGEKKKHFLLGEQGQEESWKLI